MHPGEQDLGGEFRPASAGREEREQSEEHGLRPQTPGDHPHRPVEAEQEYGKSGGGRAAGHPRDAASDEDEAEAHEEVALQMDEPERGRIPPPEHPVEKEEGSEQENRQGLEARRCMGPRAHDAGPVRPLRPQILEIQSAGGEEVIGRGQDFSVVGDPPGSAGGEQVKRGHEQNGPHPGRQGFGPWRIHVAQTTATEDPQAGPKPLG